jgi:flagellar hook-associated protein 3 FlgL
MSGISQAGGWGILGRVADDASTVRSRLDTLTAQASTGRVSDNLAGLGAGARVSLNLRPQQTALAGWQSNIDQAQLRMDSTQTAMTSINQAVSDIYKKLPTLDGLDGNSVDSLAASARDALKQVTGLLNTRVGSVYLFSGADSANPPVPDGDAILTGSFGSAIKAAMQGLGTNGAAATAAAATAASTGTAPFSATLTGPASMLEVGEGEQVQTGLLANANTLSDPGSASPTGSSMRDALRGLAMLANLSSTQLKDGGFNGLVEGIRSSLGGAITGLGNEAGVLGNTQAGLDTRKTTMQATSITLSQQISNAEDVDMTKTLSSLTQVQAQLQASYKLISSVSKLSLVDYL